MPASLYLGMEVMAAKRMKVKEEIVMSGTFVKRFAS